MTSKQKYTNPKLCTGLKLHKVPMKLATNENLKGMGVVVDDPADFTTEKKTFEICTWPASGWRTMDPGCGDEAGTCEGKFDIYWDGDLLYGKNHSIATTSNHYLLGYSKEPTECVAKGRGTGPDASPETIRLWYSDYHPDGGQLFYPEDGQSFVTNLAPPLGDDVKPEHFTAFYVPAGKGCLAPARFFPLLCPFCRRRRRVRRLHPPGRLAQRGLHAPVDGHRAHVLQPPGPRPRAHLRQLGRGVRRPHASAPHLRRRRVSLRPAARDARARRAPETRRAAPVAATRPEGRPDDGRVHT